MVCKNCLNIRTKVKFMSDLLKKARDEGRVQLIKIRAIKDQK